jgi:hypothetical protein
MRLAFRTSWRVARIGHFISGWIALRREPVDLAVLRPVYSGGANWTSSRSHWASDFFMSEPGLAPMNQASIIVRQITQQLGGAWHWSPAEDGGVYLYRYLEDLPCARISPAEIRAGGIG